MKKLLLLFFGSLCLQTFSQSDNCSSATVIIPNATCINTSGTSSGATQSIPGCVGTADDDVWYQFTATQTSHQITVSPSASYDPVVQLFSGACASLNSLYCQDLTNAGQPEVINAIGLTIGNVYTFRIYHYFAGSASSTFSVCVSNPPAAPANDACGSAINLAVNSICSSTAGTSYGATQSYTSVCNGSPDDDVWYKFTANNTQQIITVTPSAGMDPVIEIFSGTCGAFNSLDCVDNNATAGSETGTEIGLTPGTVYYVRVFDYWSGNGGFPFSICVTGQSITGDDPCNAINLGTVSADCNYNTFNNTSATATSSSLAPTPSGCVGGSGAMIGGYSASSHDMWFKVIVPASGNIFITSEPNVAPSRISDGVMALYSGACGSLTQIACSDDHNYPGMANDNLPYITTTGLTPGTTVYIRYWGFGTSTGNFGLCVSSPTNDACANALYICDLNGYSANTNAYTVDRPCNMRGDAEAGPTYTWTPGSVSQGATTFGMGGAWGVGQPYPVPPNTYSFDVTIDNNSWIRFTAAAASATFSVTVGNCFSNGGIQMQIFSGTGCCNYIPVSDFQQSASSFALTANSLTVGQDYYLMVDGWGGDICNYTVTANSGVQFAAITAVPSTICYSDSTKLTGPAGASSYLWSPGGQTTQVITVAPPTSMTYSCIVSGVCGNKQTLSKAITVNPLPIVKINSATSQTLNICANTTTTLTATGASTYTWNPATGLSASTGNVVTITPSATTNTTYTVTGTSASGCKSTASITIKGLTLPSFSITNVHPNTCSNQKDTLTAVPSSAGTYTYSWSNGAITASITPTITSNTVLTVVVTNTNNCTSSVSTTVTVLALPTVSSNTASTCNGQSALLTGTGANTYTWSPAATLSSATGTTVTATPAVPTNYTITGTALNGCVNTGTTSVNVSPTPTVQINGSTSQTINICAGTTTTLTASGAASYSWSTGANTTSIAVTPTAGSSITYVVTGTNVAGCKNTATITVNGQALPSVALNTTAQSVCNGQTYTLTASSSSSLSYTWSTGATGTGTSLSITPTVTNTNVYTVTALDAGTGCKITATSTLTMLPLPSISSNTATICNGQSATLTGNGGVSYTWTPAATLSSGGVSTTSVFATPTITTNYTIIGVAANTCTNVNTTTVVVNSLPPVAVNSATVCAGVTSTLNAIGATTYSWSTSQSGPSISVTPGSTTSYTVTGTSGLGCKNTAVSTVSVNPVPTLNTAPTISPSNCGAATGAITGLGVTGIGTLSYTWTNSSNTVVGNSPNINNQPAGNYNVFVTDANCSATFGPFYISNPGAPPVPTITSNTTTACAGQSITVSASSGASSPTFNWSGPNSFTTTSASFTLNPVTANESGVYAITVTSAGCTNTNTVSLTIHALPLVDATSISNAYCSGTTVILNGSSASTYTWSGPGSYSSNVQNPQIINSTTLTTGIYTLTATDLNGCKNTDTAKVTVNLTPLLSGVSAGAYTLCEGQTLQLNATITPSTAGINWSGPNGFSSSLANPGIPSIIPAQSGTYTVTATIGNCSSATNTLNIVVNPTPVATASISSNVACTGSNVTLSASGGGTYTWSGPNSYTSALQNNVLNNVVISTTGIYTLTATNSFGCFDTATVNLTVAPSPSITSYSTNAINNTICQGQSIQLTETHTPTAASITWAGPNGYNSPPMSTIFSPTVTGTYTVIATVGSCQSPGLDTVRITVNPTPIAIASVVGSSTVCSGITVVISGGSSGNTYNWSGPAGNNLSSQQNYTLTNVATTATGIYTLTVTNSYSCSSSDTAYLTVNQTPIISSILTNANNNTFCAGQTIQLSATANPASAPIAWTGPAGFASPPQSTTISNATILQSGTYTATTTVGTCTSAASIITITVNPTPTASATASNSVICSGNTLTLNGSGGGNYYWYGPDGTSTLATFTTTANTSGIYTLVVTNSFNCKDSVTTSVMVNITPGAATTTGAKTCTGGTLTLSATGNGTINWYSDVSLTNLVNTGTTYNPTVISGTTTIYYVTVTSNNNCVSASSATVSAGNFNIQTVATANIYSGNAPLPVNFSGVVTGCSFPTYSWTLGDNTISNNQNPSHTYNAAGDYSVTLIGKDPISLCAATATLTIHVLDETIIIIPNIFTPNGDGINDGFFVTTKGVKSIEGFIMNRWGQMMFTWNGLNDVWDGKAPNGNLETDGVYFYVFTITTNKGESKEYKGPLTLVR